MNYAGKSQLLYSPSLTLEPSLWVDFQAWWSYRSQVRQSSYGQWPCWKLWWWPSTSFLSGWCQWTLFFYPIAQIWWLCWPCERVEKLAFKGGHEVSIALENPSPPLYLASDITWLPILLPLTSTWCSLVALGSWWLSWRDMECRQLDSPWSWLSLSHSLQ